MNYAHIYTIATQGMNIEKLRVDVVANNIANQHSIHSAQGALFHPYQVLSTAKSFSTLVDEIQPYGIESVELIAEHVVPNKEYQPGHPAADQQGYVTYPGVNTLDEMTTLVRASLAYEANIKIINTAHTLFLHALSIGDEQ